MLYIKLLYRVLNVYQFGSRVWKCHSSESDWDFRIVVEGGYVLYHILYLAEFFYLLFLYVVSNSIDRLGWAGASG